MSRFYWMFAAIGLVACSKDKGEEGEGGDDSDPGACDTEVSTTVPADDAVDAYWQADVEFHLSVADTSAALALADASGAAVSGSSWLSEDAKIVYFTPSSPLSPGATYTATGSLCDGEKAPSISFTTSSYGTPLDCDLTGLTYVLDLANARFVKPSEEVGELLLGQLEQDILVGVVTYDDTTLQMIGAISDSTGGQDFCNPSIDFPEADFSESPYFIVGPETTTIEFAGVPVTISDLEVSGTFASDCSAFGGGVLAGVLDARVLGAALEDLIGTSDPAEICALLAGFGVACEACTDGEMYCVEVLADQMTATLKEGTTLECVAGDECHANCATSSKNPKCDTSNYPTCE